MKNANRFSGIGRWMCRNDKCDSLGLQSMPCDVQVGHSLSKHRGICSKFAHFGRLRQACLFLSLQNSFAFTWLALTHLNVTLHSTLLAPVQIISRLSQRMHCFPSTQGSRYLPTAFQFYGKQQLPCHVHGPGGWWIQNWITFLGMQQKIWTWGSCLKF